MFARTTTVQFKVNRVDEAIRIYEQNIVPIARSLKGYKGIYLLVDRETGNGISLSLWSEEEGAVASGQGGRFAEEMPKLADVMTAPPRRGKLRGLCQRMTAYRTQTVNGQA